MKRAPKAVAKAADIPQEIISGQPVIIGRRRQHRVDILLSYGSITEADCGAVLLGMFSGVTPSGPARALDRRLDGAITEFTDRRMFSGLSGEVFVMPTGQHLLRASNVVFAGLGLPCEFGDEVLLLAAENAMRTLLATKIHDLATVLMGVGSGLSIDASVQSLLRGFLRGLLDRDRRHRFRSITLCEVNRPRYERMKREVIRLATTSLFDEVEITVQEQPLPIPADDQRPLVVTERVTPTPWMLRPLPPADPVYMFVREARQRQPASLSRTYRSLARSRSDLELRYSVLPASGKATVLVERQTVSEGELAAHLRMIDDAQFATAKGLRSFGSALARLLLPAKIDTALKAMPDRPLVIVHDALASRMPWETICLGGWFPAAKAGLIRQYAAEELSVAKWLEERRYGNRLDVLLVVDPTEDLPSARLEGTRIMELFQANPAIRVEPLQGAEAKARAVKEALNSGEFDVVHYAGHAYFDEVDRAQSGIICHGKEVLSGADLASLSRLPALVFFNACESGRIRAAGVRGGQRKVARQGTGARQKESVRQGKAARQRKAVRQEKAARARGGEGAFAPRGVRQQIDRNVSLAEAFLRGGIASYVGTYWPVGDDAAKAFAEAFYVALLNGSFIGEAVLRGRGAVSSIGSTDWADYVFYGSQSFVLKYGEQEAGEKER
jgi:hypothetical protein